MAEASAARCLFRQLSMVTLCCMLPTRLQLLTVLLTGIACRSRHVPTPTVQVTCECHRVDATAAHMQSDRMHSEVGNSQHIAQLMTSM